MAEQNRGMQVAEQQQLLPSEPQAAPDKKTLLTLIREWPLSRKIATGAVLVISLGVFAILIFQARTADRQLLYANLDLNDAAAVTEWLKNQKIDYTLKNGGRDIWISAPLIYQTRLELAANSLPSGGGVGFEIFDKQSFALTDYVQKVNYTRALQGELARTISSLAPVESTRVHLALPERKLFRSEQTPATASVIVTLVPGKTLSPKQVQGIVNLVAGSVTGLEAEHVKVIDANGVILESDKPADEEKLLSADMLAYQREVESRLELQAQDLLDRSMGKDNAMVRVAAALDFAKVEKSEELYDADDPVVRSEQITQESSGTDTTGGIPGVQSNLQGIQPSQGGVTTPPSSKNSRITNYEISKTVSKIVNPIGTIDKLSVSVLVADRVPFDDKGKPGAPVPRTPEELKSIENMVASAIGIVPQRGDVINVISMPFADAADDRQPADQSPENLLYRYIPLAKYVLILLGLLLTYFFLIRPIIKTMKGEVQEHYKTVKELEREQLMQLPEEPLEPPPPVDEAIIALRREVQQNQIPTAFIVKNWIQEG